MTLWKAPVGTLTGTVSVPGSKSETNRALVLAALADGPGRIRGALVCRDTDLMVAGLAQFGVTVETGNEWVITPPAELLGGGRIDCGLAGTVMRFLPPVAALARGRTEFFGDEQASSRPMRPILEALEQLGIGVSGDSLPFSIDSDGVSGAAAVIDSSASSQFISGMLLAGARFPHGLHIEHIGADLPSRPHIAMTVDMLRARGVRVDALGDSWMVSPGSIAALTESIEPDLTNAATFLAGAVLSGGDVTIEGWARDSTQPGKQFVDVLGAFGVRHEYTAIGLRVQGGAELRPIDINLANAAELVPVVAAMALFAHGESRIGGVEHIRGHETDRLSALATEFDKLGASLTQTPDGLIIGGGKALHPATFATYADHRMAHAGALIGLRVPALMVADVECTAKTMPEFPEVWARCVR